MEEEVIVSPADPLNLTGILLPGPRTGTLGQEPLVLGRADDRSLSSASF
jgi:hypothetical protein